ncbi:hypothetical protein L209DRAFT_290973 [Thermothelomyces heterothallicus CBS 203.75]
MYHRIGWRSHAPLGRVYVPRPCPAGASHVPLKGVVEYCLRRCKPPRVYAFRVGQVQHTACRGVVIRISRAANRRETSLAPVFSFLSVGSFRPSLHFDFYFLYMFMPDSFFLPPISSFCLIILGRRLISHVPGPSLSVVVRDKVPTCFKHCILVLKWLYSVDTR